MLEHLVERRGGGLFVHRQGDRLLRLAEQLDQHVVFGRKVEVERAPADLRLLGDVVDAAGGDAVSAKNLERREVDAAVGLFTLFVSNHAGGTFPRGGGDDKRQFDTSMPNAHSCPSQSSARYRFCP
jgi:hypothetical protein